MLEDRPYQVVWFKRDLRLADHRPLVEATALGPVVPLYVLEPALWRQPDASQRHWRFVRESLLELDGALRRRGSALWVARGEITTVLERLLARLGRFSLHSHQETGNAWSFARDRAVADWARERGVDWREHPQQAVIRGRLDRDRWDAHWRAFMSEPIPEPPSRIRSPLPERPAEALLPVEWLEPLEPDEHRFCQPGGRRRAEGVLAGFIDRRGRRYHREMSSPNTAYRACSRLSPHLAWGTLSIREVVLATREARARDRGGGRDRALGAFESRLHWHCHFIQKLESEPRIETRNLQRACDGLRDGAAGTERLWAWQAGRTGFPFVDACMRALRYTGWINFRMRSMLMAFASYHLWLDWREPGLHLARCFTDYEPGIHWPQVQMQSGTTGINAMRIYNPVKQSLEQDPHGRFIRRWVPELRRVPDSWIHAPGAMTPRQQAHGGVRIGVDYPPPLVDHEAAAREAREKLRAVRRDGGARDEARAIHRRHGSRRRRPRRSDRAESRQGRLFE